MTASPVRSARALFLLAGLLPLLSSAAPCARWFAEGDAFDRRREEKVAVLSPDRLSALRKLIATRDARQTEVVVLGRLAEEKAAAVAEMDRRFAGEYGIRADRNYTYDPSDATVYLLSEDPARGGSAEKPARLPHRVFPTDAESQAFLALMQAKQEALAARRVFLSERTAKEAALAGVLDRMGRDFNLDPSRGYRLDPPTRSVFAEYVPPRAPTPEERAAAAAAEKKSKQEALEKAKKLRDEAKRLAAEKERLTAEEEEAERLRREELRRVEKELAELDAREASRAREAAKAKAEAERRAADALRREAEAKAKAEREKARAAELAKKEAERKAREEAEAKAKEAREKARAAELAKKEAERKAREEAETKAKAEAEQARANAIRAEEEALAAHVAEVSGERSRRRDEVARRKTAAEAGADRAAKALADVESRLSRLREEGRLTEVQRDLLTAQVAAAKTAYASAEVAVKQAAKDLAEAEKALSSTEADARKAFYANLRAQGKTPLTEPRGFFSWF